MQSHFSIEILGGEKKGKVYDIYIAEFSFDSKTEIYFS